MMSDRIIAQATELLRNGHAPTLVLAALVVACLLGAVFGGLDTIAWMVHARRSHVTPRPPIPITEGRRRARVVRSVRTDSSYQRETGALMVNVTLCLTSANAWCAVVPASHVDRFISLRLDDCVSIVLAGYNHESATHARAIAAKLLAAADEIAPLQPLISEAKEATV